MTLLERLAELIDRLEGLSSLVFFLLVVYLAAFQLLVKLLPARKP